MHFSNVMTIFALLLWLYESITLRETVIWNNQKVVRMRAQSCPTLQRHGL